MVKVRSRKNIKKNFKKNYTKKGGSIKSNKLRSLHRLSSQTLSEALKRASSNNRKNLAKKIIEKHGNWGHYAAREIEKDPFYQSYPHYYAGIKRKDMNIGKLLISFGSDLWNKIVDSEKFKNKHSAEFIEKYGVKIKTLEMATPRVVVYGAFGGNDSESNNISLHEYNKNLKNKKQIKRELLKDWESLIEEPKLYKLDKFTHTELNKILEYYYDFNYDEQQAANQFDIPVELIEEITRITEKLKEQYSLGPRGVEMKNFLRKNGINLVFTPFLGNFSGTNDNFTINKKPISYLSNINKLGKRRNTNIEEGVDNTKLVKLSNVLHKQGLTHKRGILTHDFGAEYDEVRDESGLILYEFFKDFSHEELENLEFFMPSKKLHREVMRQSIPIDYLDLEEVN